MGAGGHCDSVRAHARAGLRWPADSEPRRRRLGAETRIRVPDSEPLAGPGSRPRRPPRVAAGPGPRQEDFRAGIMMVTVRSSVPLSGLEPYSVGSDSLGANGNLKTRKRATC